MTAFEAANFATNCAGKQLILNHNLHSAYIHDIDERFRRLYGNADCIIIDGTPIRWLAARYMRRGLSPQYRIGSTDWIAALPQVRASRRLFAYGATEESNTRALENLRQMLPSWTIDGINGFVNETSAISNIKEFNPDIVLVGLGMPKQESFLLAHYDELPPATYATVGGAIDYLAGTTRLAPRWLARFGLEWAWRLIHQPRRLAHRYLIEPLLLLRRVYARYQQSKPRSRQN